MLNREMVDTIEDSVLQRPDPVNEFIFKRGRAWNPQTSLHSLSPNIHIQILKTDHHAFP